MLFLCNFLEKMKNRNLDVSALPGEGIADYTAETLIFAESALEVSPDVSFSEKPASGDNVTPDGTLYVRSAGASEGSSFVSDCGRQSANIRSKAQKNEDSDGERKYPFPVFRAEKRA